MFSGNRLKFISELAPEGMVLAAGPGGKDIFLLAPDTGAKAGMKVT